MSSTAASSPSHDSQNEVEVVEDENDLVDSADSVGWRSEAVVVEIAEGIDEVVVIEVVECAALLSSDVSSEQSSCRSRRGAMTRSNTSAPTSRRKISCRRAVKRSTRGTCHVRPRAPCQKIKSDWSSSLSVRSNRSRCVDQHAASLVSTS